MIFLGGTCGANTWREDIVIPGLVAAGIAEEHTFNPVVEHWDEQAQRREDEIKNDPKTLSLFVIASPGGNTANVSAYSIIEAVMSLYDRPGQVVVVLDTTDMPMHTAKALGKGLRDLRKRFPESPIFEGYDTAIAWISGYMREKIA